jgi:hypothetical protein
VIVTPWYSTNSSNAARIGIPGTSVVNRGWSWQGEVQDPLGLQAPMADIVRQVPSWPPPGQRSAFAFAFGSCFTHAFPAPTITQARGANPQFFAMLGDMGYVDFGGSQNYARYSSSFVRWMTRTEVAGLLSASPIMAMQDDHDYGLDECWAQTVKGYAAQAFADVVPGTQYPALTYRRWSLGDVDVWLLDCRRYKDPKSTQGGVYENGRWMSVLRQTQRTWLLNGLAGSSARVKIVLSPMAFSFDWSGNEQNLVRQWVNEHVTGTVIFCSGDRHATAFVHSPAASQIWELLAGPLNNEVKHPVPNVRGLLWSENPGGRPRSSVVGIVEVDTQTPTPYVNLRAVTGDGRTLHGETVQV